jgi:hypothetical protein
MAVKLPFPVLLDCIMKETRITSIVLIVRPRFDYPSDCFSKAVRSVSDTKEVSHPTVRARHVQLLEL